MFKETLIRFASRRWFPPLVALGAALDAFVFLIPVEALLIAAVFIRRKAWLSIAAWVSLGSAIGAVTLAAITHARGENFLLHWMPQIYHSPTWENASALFRSKGLWALPVIALSPVPQQPAAALAGLLHLSLIKVFMGILLGRAIKYGVVAWSVAFSPDLFKKLNPFKKRRKKTASPAFHEKEAAK